MKRSSLPTLFATAIVFCLPLIGCSPSGDDSTDPDGAGTPAGSPSGGTDGAGAGDASAAAPRTGREVFERMAAAYQSATSYADQGELRTLVQQNGEIKNQQAPFALAFERPDRLRLEAFQAKVLLDSEKLYAAVRSLPEQVVVRDGPEELSLRLIDRSPVLSPVLGEQFASTSVRLVLLMADDPLPLLLGEAEPPELVTPDQIGGRACHRVRVRRDGQTATFWVDKQSYALRRIDLPTADLFNRPGVTSASRIAEFVGAELNVELPAATFQFQVPAGARQVKFFLPPHPADWLGQPAPEFTLVNPEGEAVTKESLRGKTAVLEFWTTSCGPCRISLPKLGDVAAQYADDPDVAFYAVSLDPPDVSDSEVRQSLDQLDQRLELLRDPRGQLASRLNSAVTPSLFVLGPEGRVQHFEIGSNPTIAQTLPKLIDRVAAGEPVFEAGLAEREADLQKYEQMINQAEQGQGPGAAETEIAPASEPQALKMQTAWTVEEFDEPNNILPFQRDGETRLAVVDGFRRIAELSLDGRVLATHDVELQPGEAFNTLRTAVGPEGRRYFAAVAILMGQQRFHLLDGRFQRLLSYPESALENPHAGIGDVQLAALQPGGPPRAVVGYWGGVGVQAVSLEGERLWANRNVQGVQCLALGPAVNTGAGDSQGDGGGRQVLCAGASGALEVLGPEGEVQPPLSLPDRKLVWVAGSDFGIPGAARHYCALTGGEVGRNEAVGLTIRRGQLTETWSYRLPDGVPGQPIELIVPGRIAVEDANSDAAEGPDTVGVWLLPGPDGSIHIVDVEGRVVERFNYGAALGGLALIHDRDRGLLVISSPGKVEALRVER